MLILLAINIEMRPHAMEINVTEILTGRKRMLAELVRIGGKVWWGKLSCSHHFYTASITHKLQILHCPGHAMRFYAESLWTKVYGGISEFRIANLPPYL